MRIPAILIAALLLAACNADRNPAPASRAPVPKADNATADIAGHDTTSGKAYDCGSGVIVTVLPGDRLRATIPGQPTIDLARIANSTPPVYTGANLYFTLGENGVYLSQEDGTELACQPQ